jgi:6-phosphogluconolactonase
MRTQHSCAFRALVRATTIVPKQPFLTLLSALSVSAFLSTTPVQAEFVYATNYSDSTISAYRVSPNGALTPLPGSPFASQYFPTGLAFDSTTDLLYVANGSTRPKPTESAGTVISYSVDSTGALTAASSVKVNTGANWGLAIDPARHSLYVPGGHGSTGAAIAEFRMSSDGTLSKILGSPFLNHTPQPFQSITSDPTANFLYVSSFKSGKNLFGFKIGAKGALKPVAGSPFSGPPPRGALGMAIDPSGSFLLFLDLNANSISVDAIGSDGALTPVTGSPFANTGGPYNLVVTPNGQFVYVADITNSTVSGYNLHSDGSLTPVPNSPFAAGKTPSGLAVDSTGKFLYVANFGGNNVSGYSINSDGSLGPLPGSPYATGNQPQAVLVTP